MTNDQVCRSNMYGTTIAFSDANESITDGLVNFSVNLADLRSIQAQIHLIGEEQKLDRKGITEGKNKLRAGLIVLSADAARKVATYARFSNNSTLLGEVSMKESDFKRYADNELIDYSQIIYNRAQSNVVLLGDYAITDETQTALLNAINEFKAFMPNPRLGKITKAQATKQLVELYKKGDIALANMDASVEIIRLTQPNFYAGYHAARKLILIRPGKLSLKMQVTDAETGEPVKGAIASIAPESDSKSVVEKKNVIEKKMADKGGANIKSLVSGTYLVTIRKAGYADQTLTISVSDGEMTVLNVKLAKS